MKFITVFSAGVALAASFQTRALAAKKCIKRADVPVWGQCGGISYTGSESCAAGSTCVVVNSWYSQCQPSSASPTPATTSTTIQRATLTDVSVWGQCGGISYTGSKSCAAGSTCVILNPWYSQCQPSSATPTLATSLSSATPATTSTTTQGATSTPEPSVSSTANTSKAAVTTSSSSSPVSTSVPNIGYTPVSGMYPLGAMKSSIATTYGGNWPGGMCSFSDYPHIGLNGVALGKEQWFGAAGCGACIKITGASGSVVAMVNDQCPECTDNHLDLDEAYAAQVDVNFRTKGIFDITWEFVTCPVSGNLQFKNKEGTSAYYFALQVRNSVLPIDTLEVSTNGGASWTNVHREDYNFFTSYSGFGDTVDVRVTSTTGQQIIEKGIKVSSGSIVQGTQQFSA